jgi:hypothetical protein
MKKEMVFKEAYLSPRRPMKANCVFELGTCHALAFQQSALAMPADVRAATRPSTFTNVLRPRELRLVASNGPVSYLPDRTGVDAVITSCASSVGAFTRTFDFRSDEATQISSRSSTHAYRLPGNRVGASASALQSGKAEPASTSAPYKLQLRPSSLQQQQQWGHYQQELDGCCGGRYGPNNRPAQQWTATMSAEYLDTSCPEGLVNMQVSETRRDRLHLDTATAQKWAALPPYMPRNILMDMPWNTLMDTLMDTALATLELAPVPAKLQPTTAPLQPRAQQQLQPQQQQPGFIYEGMGSGGAERSGGTDNHHAEQRTGAGAAETALAQPR